MDSGSILIFVGIIVGGCIVGGATYSGLGKIAEALSNSPNQ